MQLSFPSVPNDPTAAVLTPSAAPADSAATDPSGSGFAQMLAGIGSPVSTPPPPGPATFDGSFGAIDAFPAAAGIADTGSPGNALSPQSLSTPSTTTAALLGGPMLAGTFLPNLFVGSNSSTSGAVPNISAAKTAGFLGKGGQASTSRLTSVEPTDLADEQMLAAILAQISGGGTASLQPVAEKEGSGSGEVDAAAPSLALSSGTSWVAGGAFGAGLSPTLSVPGGGPFTATPPKGISGVAPLGPQGTAGPNSSTPGSELPVRAMPGQTENGAGTAANATASMDPSRLASTALPLTRNTTTAQSDLAALPVGTDLSKVAADVETRVELPQVGASTAAPISANAGVGGSLSPMANFAAASGLPQVGGGATEKAATKSALAAGKQKDAQLDPGLGIDSATRLVTMSAGQPFAHSTTPETTAVVSATSVTDARNQQEGLPQSVALASTAHRAVEAALNVADRFSARDQHSVNLQFSVGGSDLNVRVELRGGEVHTTFRTDSAELRTALSNEWNAVTTQTGADRTNRLAAPVFTSTDTSGSFSGDSASRQRDPESRGSSPNPFNLGTSRGSSSTSAQATTAPVPSSLQTAAANSIHLHTLA